MVDRHELDPEKLLEMNYWVQESYPNTPDGVRTMFYQTLVTMMGSGVTFTDKMYPHILAVSGVIFKKLGINPRVKTDDLNSPITQQLITEGTQLGNYTLELIQQAGSVENLENSMMPQNLAVILDGFRGSRLQ